MIVVGLFLETKVDAKLGCKCHLFWTLKFALFPISLSDRQRDREIHSHYVKP